jgi:hypothetical protein
MGLALILATAVVGLVWLSMAFARAVELYIDPDWGAWSAPTIVAAIFLAPLCLFFLVRLFRRPSKDESHSAVPLTAQPDNISEITRMAEAVAEKSPLTALAIAVLAGFLAARFPSALFARANPRAPINRQKEAPQVSNRGASSTSER